VLPIQSGETVLISTEEYIGLPKNKTVAGIIESKVSIVSKGLSHVSTTLDPDWEGHLLIAVTNHQPHAIELRRGDPFCTVMFLLCQSPATDACHAGPGRKDIVEDLLSYFLEQSKLAEKTAQKRAEEEAKKAKRSLLERIPTSSIQFLVISFFALLGFLFFGISEGFSAMVAAGVGIAAIVIPDVLDAIRSRTEKNVP